MAGLVETVASDFISIFASIAVMVCLFVLIVVGAVIWYLFFRNKQRAR